MTDSPEATPRGVGGRRAATLAAGGLALVTAIAFARCVGHDFVDFDDPLYARDNPWVRGGLSAAGLRWAFTTFEMANWHPLTWLSLQLDATLFGTGPRGYHRTNVLLHAANAAVFLLALWRMTGALGRSAAAAGLFALHPLRVESVAWVAERKDVLSLFFGLLALLAYGGYARRRGAARYLAVAALFALSLLAKPTLVTFPCVLLLLDAWPLARFGREPAWRLAAEKLPLFALAAGASVAAVLAQASGGVEAAALGDLGRYTAAERAANAVLAYAAYLRAAFWPAGLAVFYPHPHASFWEPRVLAAGAVLAALTTAALAARRRLPAVAVGWLWFLGALVPVIGLVQVGDQGWADRYAYWPHAGLFLALAWGAAALADRLALPPAAAAAAAAAALLACAALTWRQSAVWADSLSLWGHAVEATGPNPTARVGLGAALRRAGRSAESLEQYRAAAALDPRHPLAHTNLGGLLCDLGRPAEAVGVLEAIRKERPDLPTPHYGLGVAYGLLGRPDDAARHYREALRLDPGYANARYNLGLLLSQPATVADAEAELREAVRLRPDFAEAHRALGETLAWQGRDGEAVACYRRALESDPNNAPAAENLAAALERLGRPGEAAEAAARAASLQPRQADFHATLALCLSSLGRPARAAAEYAAAGRLQPDWPQRHLRLAHVAAAHPDPRFRNAALAVQAARRVAEAFPERPEGHDALAAAYAEAGRFDQAVAEARRARDLALPGSEPSAGAARRLSGYEKHEPFRDPSLK